MLESIEDILLGRLSPSGIFFGIGSFDGCSVLDMAKGIGADIFMSGFFSFSYGFGHIGMFCGSCFAVGQE